MAKNILIALILSFIYDLSFGQSISSYLIGSTGETAKTKLDDSGISLTYSVGEPIVDYHKCVYNYRIGFIQAIPVHKQSEVVKGFHLPSNKTDLPPNRSSDTNKENEKYILFDVAGRVLKRGFNFKKEDPFIQFPYSGIYFVHTSVNDKNVRIEKIMFAK